MTENNHQSNEHCGDKKVGVLVIHGVGTQKEDYAKKMIAELKERLGKAQNQVEWEPVYWANILAPRQMEYLREAAKGRELDWVWARRLVVNALSDAASYRRMQPDCLDHPITTYGKIHQRVRAGLRKLKKRLGADGSLVVLAHSLGGHIISNYIWDVQKGNVVPQIGPESYEGAGSLKLLVTFGCNIPLFTFSLDKVVPITLKKGAKWHNYYDRDDVLGYPLRPINSCYEKVCKDIEINVGGFLSSWNFFSHNKYWTDNDFTKPVAESISKVVAGNATV